MKVRPLAIVVAIFVLGFAFAPSVIRLVSTWRLPGGSRLELTPIDAMVAVCLGLLATRAIFGTRSSAASSRRGDHGHSRSIRR